MNQDLILFSSTDIIVCFRSAKPGGLLFSLMNERSPTASALGGVNHGEPSFEQGKTQQRVDQWGLHLFTFFVKR